MAQRDARVFWSVRNSDAQDWNIVELESHRQLLQQIDALIGLLQTTSCTRSAISQRLQQLTTQFGERFARYLVRALRHAEHDDRHDIVWLLTVLDDPATIGPLQRLAHNKRLPRAVRLSASLALAGQGATAEMQSVKKTRLYAM